MAKKNPTPENLPHIGQMLRGHFKKNRISKAALGRTIGRLGKLILRDEKKEQFPMALLWQYSQALGHNFFADLAAQLPSYFTTNAPDPTLPLRTRIAELEEEVKLLKVKVETLEGVVGK